MVLSMLIKVIVKHERANLRVYYNHGRGVRLHNHHARHLTMANPHS